MVAQGPKDEADGFERAKGLGSAKAEAWTVPCGAAALADPADVLRTTAKVWDAATGSLLRTLEGHELSVNVVAFSPDGHRLATASRDKTALVWDLRDDAAPPVVLEGHDSCVNGIAFAPDGSRVATASNDKRCIVWDASTGELESLEGHENWVEGCAFARRTSVATASQDHHARVWEGGVCVMTLAGHGKRVNDVAFAGDGRRS
ncbi:hypothetical protein JL722_15153 [Aureococcus anophagefferens]|nr:hypothetical protein JL722_15153 [Aureococcus anophagefferens]